jgi:hypothetical protein
MTDGRMDGRVDGEILSCPVHRFDRQYAAGAYYNTHTRIPTHIPTHPCSTLRTPRLDQVKPLLPARKRTSRSSAPREYAVPSGISMHAGRSPKPGTVSLRAVVRAAHACCATRQMLATKSC